MKTIVLFTSMLYLSLSGFSQSEVSKELPPFEQLPKSGEVKQMFELPDKLFYQVYDQSGKLVEDSTGRFVDYTNYQAGTYFVRFAGKTGKFEKVVDSDAK